MVFIKSQEYTNAFGKKSKNIICLEGQSDYKMAFNSDTGLYDVTIVMGDFEKFIFSATNEEQVDKIMQNLFTHHHTKEPNLIFDINAFMIPDVQQSTTLEELEELMANILEFHGYSGLVDAWETKMNEEYAKQVDGETSPLLITNTGEVVVGQIQGPQDPTSPFVEHQPAPSDIKYAHYQ